MLCKTKKHHEHFKERKIKHPEHFEESLAKLDGTQEIISKSFRASF